jgi:hypothetical protein
MARGRPRNTAAMLASRRCGARTRAGKPCMSPAVHGKKRCRMHGGASGSGAPRGNKNALKHGLYTRAATDLRRGLQDLVRQSVRLVQEIGLVKANGRARGI